MQQPENTELVKSIIQEVNGHFEKKRWILVPKEDFPKGDPVLDSVWAMRLNRSINTRRVYKWKYILSLHCEQQEYGRNYT